MVPRSKTKAKIVVASWDNKTLVGAIKLRFRDGHDIWNWTRFVTKCYFPESKSWKKPLAEKPCWQTKGNVNMTEWMISTPQQPAPYRYMQLYVLSYEKQHWVNDINTNCQPMWSSTVRASSYRHYLICYEKQHWHWQTWKTFFWEKSF